MPVSRSSTEQRPAPEKIPFYATQRQRSNDDGGHSSRRRSRQSTTWCISFNIDNTNQPCDRIDEWSKLLSNKSPRPLESLEEWPKPIKMTEPYVVDFNIFEGARPVFNTKYFSIDHAESLSDAIQSVFKERSDEMWTEIEFDV